MVSSNREGQDTPELLQDSRESISVPQNTEVQFNSADIGKKEEPEYFERVKEKSSTKAKKQVDEAAKKTGSFFGKIFKSIGTFFANFGKLITKNKTTKIITAAILVLILAGATFGILKLTIWRESSTPETIIEGDPSEDRDAEIAEWNQEIYRIRNHGKTLSDDEYMEYYNGLIQEETDYYKLNSLYLAYAWDLTNRGFTSYAETVLSTIKKDKLTCQQETDYLLDYYLLYKQIGDNETSDTYATMYQERSVQCNEEGWNNL